MNTLTRAALVGLSAVAFATPIAACGSSSESTPAASTVRQTLTETTTVTKTTLSTVTVERAPAIAATTPSAAAETSYATTTQQQASDAGNSSIGQLNAQRKAQEYLSIGAFSRTGLIDQLAYEGFSQSDATYAVDNISVNWTEQARKKAAEYMSISAMSRQGLFDQLVYEGFTPAQAEAGAASQY